MTSAAVEQRRVDELFQLLNTVSDYRAGDAQLLSRLGEVSSLGNADKGFDTE